MNKGGKLLQQVGLAQYANAHLSMPASSGKIWTPHTRLSASVHAPSMLNNSRQYDWRPKGESINWETKNSPTYDPGQKKLRGREAHWARRPLYNQGIYSQPTVSEIHYHRKSQKRKGQGKMALGTGMRFLGRGLLVYQLGTYAKWIHDDWQTAAPKIIEDLTFARWLKPLAEGAAESDNLDFSQIPLTLGSVV